MRLAPTSTSASVQTEGGQSIPAFQTHGGRLRAAVAAYPDAPQPWIDLSTGINPWPWPVPHLPADIWARLPDPAALDELERIAADYVGLGEAETLVAVPGSEIGLRLIAQLRPAARVATACVAIVSPTYSGHRDAWAGHDVRACGWEQAVAQIDELDVLVLVRPNNPDGAVIPHHQLEDVAARLAVRGGWLVIDEAFTDADSALAETREGSRFANVIRLRSFGKFFGLAGVRLGFVIAAPAFAGRIRALLGDWPVSGPAIEIGMQAYRDRHWQQEMRTRLALAAARLDRMLEQNGLRVCGGTSLFRLVQTPHAAALFSHLARSGILTRPFAEQPDWLRFGLPGGEDEWMRLEAALASWEHPHDRS